MTSPSVRWGFGSIVTRFSPTSLRCERSKAAASTGDGRTGVLLRKLSLRSPLPVYLALSRRTRDGSKRCAVQRNDHAVIPVIAPDERQATLARYESAEGGQSGSSQASSPPPPFVALLSLTSHSFPPNAFPAMATYDKDYAGNEKDYQTNIVTRGTSSEERGELDRVPPENDLHRGLKARQ